MLQVHLVNQFVLRLGLVATILLFLGHLEVLFQIVKFEVGKSRVYLNLAHIGELALERLQIGIIGPLTKLAYVNSKSLLIFQGHAAIVALLWAVFIEVGHVYIGQWLTVIVQVVCDEIYLLGHLNYR